jgi:uncharacterized membrane protein
MNNLPKILVAIALICLLIAVGIKISTLGKLLPAPMPLNWARLADTVLLFAIAIALLGKK